jgi:two-component system nitrate/nitrite response regulator NarL
VTAPHYAAAGSVVPTPPDSPPLSGNGHAPSPLPRLVLGSTAPAHTIGAPVTVLVADSQPVARAGLTESLNGEPDLKVIASVEDGGQALEAIRSARPAVALIDVRVPVVSGLQVLEGVTTDRLPCRVVLIAPLATGLEVHDAMVAGAAGYLTKGESIETIYEGIRQASAGGQYLSPESQAALVEQIRRGGRTQSLLSLRELEILRLTAEGVTSAAIGRRLHLSQSTVKNHQQNLYSKLGVHNAPAAIYQAMRRGLLR